MRVHEFSKKSGLSNKEIIELLQDKGFEVAGHMSVLTDEMLMFLNKQTAKQEKKSSKSVAKKSVATPTKKSASPSEKKLKVAKKTTSRAKAADTSTQKQAALEKEKVTVVPQVVPQEKKVVQKPEPVVKPIVSEKVAISAQPSISKPSVEPRITPKSVQSSAQPKGIPSPVSKPVVSPVKPVTPTPGVQPQRRPEPVHGKPVQQPRPQQVQRPGFGEREAVQPRVVPQVAPQDISIPIQAMTVDQFAQYSKRPVVEVILTLLKRGVRAAKNQLLTDVVVKDLIHAYGHRGVLPMVTKEQEPLAAKVAATGTALVERMPVVVVLGHVDHGKTTLLDFIRKTRVAYKEKGGITQHIGAYSVHTAHGGIVFIDTPGHEAFSQIRSRGARVADIAILVVAADDSVKPQTVEALKSAQAANIPIIVAVNKIDKAEPQRVDVVKRDCAAYNLLPEEWGGNTIFVPVSAKVGTGIDQLLEIISLQAQIMELKADPSVPGKGFVLESKREHGRGSVATVVVQEGTFKIGDFFVCGSTQGKVTAMSDSLGRPVTQAGPSTPIQIIGFDDLARVGVVCEIVSQDQYRAARAQKGERRVLMPQASTAEKALNLIMKADSAASQEALLEALMKVPEKGDREPYLVFSGVGDVSEGDVLLATHTGATIIGLHVKVEPNASTLAAQKSVTIVTHDIIYHLLDEIKTLVKGPKKIVMVKQKVGEAVVRKVFATKSGVIAGCYVKEGRIVRDGIIVGWRGKEKLGQGSIKSLERDRKSVKEVHAGFECAFIVEGMTDWAEDDRIECVLEVPQEQKPQQ